MSQKALFALVFALLVTAGSAGASSLLSPDHAVPVRSVDNDLAQLATQIPGFGGLFYDAQGNPSVYVTDPSQVDVTQHFGENVTVLQGQYDFFQLRDWRITLRSALSLPGVVYLDLDEGANRVRIGVDENDAAAALAVQNEVIAQGVPVEAVLIEPVAPIAPSTHLLTSTHRPAPGGVQIAFGGFVCTLGFNAFRAGVFGFVTNSHCTNVQGGVESTRYGQATTSSPVATEIADPTYFTGSGCPSGRRCRFSDSSFARYDSSSTGQFGSIARPSFDNTCGNGSTTISSSSPRFTINAKVTGGAFQGQLLDKVGRTSGWTFGSVTATCADVNVSGTNITQLCQNLVNSRSLGGDSGSPVFFWPGGSTVQLHGILWGGDNSCTFVYSPIANVESELGTLTVF